MIVIDVSHPSPSFFFKQLKPYMSPQVQSNDEQQRHTVLDYFESPPSVDLETGKSSIHSDVFKRCQAIAAKAVEQLQKPKHLRQHV